MVGEGWRSDWGPLGPQFFESSCAGVLGQSLGPESWARARVKRIDAGLYQGRLHR